MKVSYAVKYELKIVFSEVDTLTTREPPLKLLLKKILFTVYMIDLNPEQKPYHLCYF